VSAVHWHRLKRGWLQAVSAIAANAYLPGFLRGLIYRGRTKALCVPFLNCYSCPGALGACPVGAFQSLAAAAGQRVSFYVLGFVTAVGAASGRLVCGWLCPFGAIQDLLGRRAPRRRLPAYISGLRYVFLLLTVALPFIIVTPLGSEPYFCKYVCPAGTLEAGIPLAIANPGIRAALGALFSWKAAVLAFFIAASFLVYRPFCRTTCPLGAFYGLFNPVALSRLAVKREECTACGRCTAACPLGIDVASTPNSPDCIRCLDCTRACPTGALRLRPVAQQADGQRKEEIRT